MSINAERAILFAKGGNNTNQEIVERLREHLTLTGMPFEIIFTENNRNGDPNININALLSLIKEGDAIMAIGGDGTVNQASNGIPAAFLNAESIRLMVVPTGRANDIAYGIGGTPITDTDTFDRALRNEPRPLDIMAVRITSPETLVANRRAVAYASMGLTAIMADKLDEPSYRERRNGSTRLIDPYDVLLFHQVLLSHNRLIINGQEYIDLDFVNSNRMAGIYNIQGSLFDGKGFTVVPIKDIVEMTKLVYQSFKSGISGIKCAEYSLPVGGYFGLQCDGEIAYKPRSHDYTEGPYRTDVTHIPGAIGAMACWAA